MFSVLLLLTYEPNQTHYQGRTVDSLENFGKFIL